jgi:putative membrane protein
MRHPSKKKIATIVIVALLPSLYLLIYLSASWNPMKHTGEIPVALVNEDKGAQIEEKHENLGKEIAENITKNVPLKWQALSVNDAEEGLKKGKYYGTLTIPADFTQNIASAGKAEKMQGIIRFTVNEKMGPTISANLKSAAEGIQKEVSKKVSEKLASKIIINVQAMPEGLKKLDEGITKIYNGSRQLTDNMGKLTGGQGAVTAKIGTLKNGLDQLAGAALQLDNASSILSAKLQEFSNNLSEEAQKAGALNDGSAQYKIGLERLSVAVEKSGDSGNLASVAKGFEQMKTAFVRLDTGIAGLVTNLKTASGYAVATADNTSKLDAGMNKLSDGIQNVSKGSGSLASASETLLAGQAMIQQGMDTLSKALADVKGAVNNAVHTSQDSLHGMDGIDRYISEPVKLDFVRMNPLQNNGAGLTPLMLSISLWIGSLLLFVAMDLVDKEKLSNNQASIVGSQVFYLGVSTVQALLAAFMLTAVMGLNVEHIGYFFIACIITSLCFTSLVQLLVNLFKDAGKILAILFLLLQMASCGGVFPIETAPAFYKAIHPYMPMTYSVKIFKDVVSATVYDGLSHNMWVLALTAVFAVTIHAGLGLLASRAKIAKASPVGSN